MECLSDSISCDTPLDCTTWLKVSTFEPADYDHSDPHRFGELNNYFDDFYIVAKVEINLLQDECLSRQFLEAEMTKVWLRNFRAGTYGIEDPRSAASLFEVLSQFEFEIDPVRFSLCTLIVRSSAEEIKSLIIDEMLSYGIYSAAKFDVDSFYYDEKTVMYYKRLSQIIYDFFAPMSIDDRQKILDDIERDTKSQLRTLPSSKS